MQFEPIFLQVLWQFLSSGFRFPPSQSFGRAGGIFGQTLAAAGGEMRPNYFKNRPPDRKLQVFVHRAAAGGDQIVRNFGRKNQLAILHFGKRKFLIKTIGSNCRLAAGKLAIDFKNPWNYLAEMPAEARGEAPSEATNRLLWCLFEKIRTHFAENPE